MKRVGLGIWAVCCGVGLTQMHPVKKPETVVRAVGVYEWTGELAKPTASRLIPVTIFIDGQMQDAGVYLPRPVPMALEPGTVFELDKAGVAAGTIDLSFARHLQPTDIEKDASYDDGWFGYGKVTPVVPPKPEVASSKVRQSQAVVETNGGRPHFSNAAGSAKDDAAKDADRPTLKKAGDAPAAGNTGAGPGDDPDRPVLKKKGDAGADRDGADRPTLRQPGASTDTTATADAKAGAKAGPEDDVDRPTLKKRTPAEQKAARKESDQASVSGVGSLNDDPNRPTLHRGKPAGTMTEDDLPRLAGLPADLHQMVAVSDATNRAEHPFARAWGSDAEREQVLGKMRELARARLAVYGSAAADAGQAVVDAPSASAARTATARAAAVRASARSSKPVAGGSATLTEEELRGYTLSYGGAPTYAFSAASPGADGVRYVTVVAQAEPSGELKVAMENVTDANHLNRTPRLRLVDAVDAEASNRASLLFELRARDTRSFALYRVIGAQAEQMFSTGSTQ